MHPSKTVLTTFFHSESQLKNSATPRRCLTQNMITKHKRFKDTEQYQHQSPLQFDSQALLESKCNIIGFAPRHICPIPTKFDSVEFTLSYPGEYYEFQVTGMIEWGQKSKPKNSLGFLTKPPKNSWTKTEPPKKSHAEFRSLKNFHKDYMI